MPAPDLLARALRVAVPPARSTTHATVAGSLLLPDGPRQGKPYRWQDDPIHQHVVKQLDSGAWDSMALVGAVQTGKSLVSILVPMLRQLIHQRRAVVYSQPSQQKLHEAWTGKVQPAIEGAGLGKWLPTDGQGARGGQTPRFVVFRDPITRARAGMLYLIHGGGANEGAQASVSAPTVLIDEVDSFKNAHRVALIGKRADSFGRTAVRILTSTVKADGEPGAEDGSIILGLYADSTRSRLHYRCPACGGWHALDWSTVTYDGDDEATAAETVRIACPLCAASLTESDRQTMLRDSRLVHHTQTVNDRGEVVGSAPPTRRFGLLWTALDSTLRDLPTLAIEHWRARQAVARGDHGAMRSFARDQLCQRYLGDQHADDFGNTIVPTRARLAALSEASDLHLDVDRTEKDGDSVHLCHVPAWAEHLTVSADVQQGGERAPGRLYFLVLARGGGRGAIVGYGSIHCAPAGRQPTVAELHAGLDRLDSLLSDWSPAVPIVLRGVDVGDRQDELLAWLSSRRKWQAIKGTGALKASEKDDRPGWIYPRKQGAGHWLGLVETESVTRICHGEILAGNGAGSIQLPHGIERKAALILHLCATVEYQPGKWSASAKDRPHHPEWQTRHDYLDCLAYARALAYWWETRPEARRQMVARQPRNEIHAAAPAQAHAQRPPARRPGRIGSIL